MNEMKVTKQICKTSLSLIIRKFYSFFLWVLQLARVLIISKTQKLLKSYQIISSVCRFFKKIISHFANLLF